MYCDVKAPAYFTNLPCDREAVWAAIMTEGRYRNLCSEHLGMFNTFGHTVISWSRLGKDTTMGIQ